ncbi:WH2 domain-containing protein family protein [Loa loa]|uniref:WH2 domain-containing protein family protein n=1 Tax=Loa loa TaxID=7209 RepID=A0A1I7V908_LOALO|nr:WH2 domain-containing protein family protein [Loa loa]EJD74833.1 WH2 domain-containing protein family protein [Loa loa]
MPVPPPPPPPPPSVLPSLSVRSGFTALQSKANDRSKLLNEIQTGMKLRKTVTNDRSAPVLGGRVSDLSETNDWTGISSGSKVPTVGGVSGLFASGIPKKPSDNKRNQANIFKGAIASPPLLPKPSEMHSVKSISHSESQEQQLPTSLVECSEIPGIYRQPSAGIANRLKQFNQINRPGLAPPTPPSLKTKPIVKDIRSLSIKQTSASEQFKTLRPNRIDNDVSSLRRSGSSDDIRNSQPSLPDNCNTALSSIPVSLNPSNSTRIPKPACPPPPPPNQASRIGRPTVHPFNHFTQVSSTPNVSVDEDSPPPPPPPRVASCADQMDRFTFIPVSELPPPGIFSGTKKVYEYHPARKIQNASSLYR